MRLERKSGVVFAEAQREVEVEVGGESGLLAVSGTLG